MMLMMLKELQKTTMHYQNEPELLEQINDAYEQILLHGMKFGTMNMTVDESFSPHCSFAVKTFPIQSNSYTHEQGAMLQNTTKPSEMMDMFSGFIKVLPEVVENVMK